MVPCEHSIIINNLKARYFSEKVDFVHLKYCTFRFGSVNFESRLLLALMVIVKETDVLNFLVAASKEGLASPVKEEIWSSVKSG